MATCPAGKFVVGGGFQYDTSQSVSVVGSFPLNDGSGWRVDIQRSNNSGTTTFTAYAVCATAA